MMRKIHRNYELPAVFDGEFDAAIRGFGVVARARSGRSLSAGRKRGSRARAVLLRESLYRLENWLFANWTEARKHNAGRARSPKPSAAAT